MDVPAVPDDSKETPSSPARRPEEIEPPLPPPTFAELPGSNADSNAVTLILWILFAIGSMGTIARLIERFLK
jgi:hypothetical protein